MATNMPNIWSYGATGAVGAAGTVYTVSPTFTGTYSMNIANATYPSAIYDTQITTNNDVIIKRPGKQDLHVAKTLEMLMERLSVLESNYELMEKYPALREAYENYKVMEALLLGGDKDNENE